uniref:Dimer_Tnp_hAT domain-containing protein n=2 Tax=Caenorhabditis japonica TaxID=281687 RepID=A0A8R1EBH0_CAEJA
MVLLCDGWTSTNSNFQLYCLVAAYVDTSGKLQQHLVGIVDTPSARSHDLQRLFIAEMSKSKLTMDQFFCSIGTLASMNEFNDTRDALFNSKETIIANFLIELLEPIHKTSLRREFELYRQHIDQCIARKVEDDSINFWRTKSATWPLLTKLALKFLSIPASSASTERVFAGAGRIFSNRLRNRLSVQTTSSILLANAMIGFERINDCEEDYGIIEDEEVAENSPIDSELGPNYEMGDFKNVEEDDMEFEEFDSSLPGPSFSFGAGDSNDATPNKILRSQKRISKRVVKSDISAPATRRRRVNNEN